MPYNIVTLGAMTAANVGPSNPIALNWRSGRPVLWRITCSSSVAVGDFTLQWTTDDIQLTTNSSIYPPTGSVTTLPATTAVWSAISSTPYGTLSTSGSAGVHFTSSTIFPDGISGTFLASPAAVRLFSTNLSSHTLTLAIVQGDGA
jgi:hypothetical protein